MNKVKTEEIVKMYQSGMTQADIAKVVGLTQTAVGFRLRGAGIRNGSGRRDPNRGGAVADTIPAAEYKVSDADVKAEEKQAIAEKNAANACLKVANRTITLEGVFGRYKLSVNDKAAEMYINNTLVKVEFDNLLTFADEIRALARNVSTLNADTGCEMW